MTGAPPEHPLAAVTHPDPYPYYADLVSRRPLYRDDALGMWVASSAGAVTAVLSSDSCRVRPPAEPVPRALLGSAAGDIFRQLVRMNDGAGHRLKPAVAATLTAFDPARAAKEARTWAARRVAELDPTAALERVSDFAFRLPVHVVASCLGAPASQVPQIAAWAHDLVRCLAPGAAPEALERGGVAARHLRDAFTVLPREHEGLLAALAAEARRAGVDDVDAVIANGVGFLSQAYEATAGLIGNTLVALARHGDLRDRGGQVVAEVLRWDSPVQNTRRFLDRDGVVAGLEMKDGDAILVVLAAANRDPAANPYPARFDPFRPDRRTFTFGLGRHACPGEMLAVTIAQAGVDQLLAVGVEPTRLLETLRYRPSANTRVPLFGRVSP